MGFGVGEVFQFPSGRRLAEDDTALITKAQAAAHLGCSERTIDRMVADGLPNHDLAGRRLFRRAEINAWAMSRSRRRT